MCQEAGFLLSPDSPALAKNWRPESAPGGESGLDPPPWFDINGAQIDYIGACPAAAHEPPATKLPEAPSNVEVEWPN